MKNTILVLGFLFVGLIGFSQQNNEGISEILHQDQNKYEKLSNDIEIKINLDDTNMLVDNNLESRLDFENNTHEITHDAFRIDDNQFDYKKGVYTFNEYAINYKLELIDITIE